MRRFLTLAAILVLLSCDNERRYDIGHFDESVMNFEDVNSVYDDYNSTAPFIWYRHFFHFSSNRNSAGHDFDIVGENMFIDWDKEKGTINISTDLNDHNFDYLLPMMDQMNTSCNELGPYSTWFTTGISSSEVLLTKLTMFASDCDGNYDIKFIYCERLNQSTEIKPVHDVSFLNSDADDLYPTFFVKDLEYFTELGIIESKVEKILFCSNREGEFNMYEVGMPDNAALMETLQSDMEVEVTKLSINSEQDDKCPFVNGRLLVFSSNRAGGLGGYDLYYSRFENGSWTAPTNFGDQINTEFDEYRPIVLDHNEFDNNLMIFSSNRPGGKGKFDLYHVGIQQSTR